MFRKRFHFGNKNMKRTKKNNEAPVPTTKVRELVRELFLVGSKPALCNLQVLTFVALKTNKIGLCGLFL